MAEKAAFLSADFQSLVSENWVVADPVMCEPVSKISREKSHCDPLIERLLLHKQLIYLNFFANSQSSRTGNIQRVFDQEQGMPIPQAGNSIPGFRLDLRGWVGSPFELQLHLRTLRFGHLQGLHSDGDSFRIERVSRCVESEWTRMLCCVEMATSFRAI